jgi:hypothetical protein
MEVGEQPVMRQLPGGAGCASFGQSHWLVVMDVLPGSALLLDRLLAVGQLDASSGGAAPSPREDTCGSDFGSISIILALTLEVL